MSLARLVYYSAVLSGWAAFVGWLLAELLVIRGNANEAGKTGLIVAGLFVGAAIGAAINLVAGTANLHWSKVAQRLSLGALVGGVGGAVGILVGNWLFSLGLPRAIGFGILGVAVGVVDGVIERSAGKIRNGLIGGIVGGLAGGWLFDPIRSLAASEAGVTSRAIAFVLLGMCIGALVGLVQMIFRQAWLTVLDGFRPGRQLILFQPITVLGRGDHLPLPFLGSANFQLDSEHLRVFREGNGEFAVECLSNKGGVSVNQEPLTGPRRLRDGDVIKFGVNFVRFNERTRRADSPSSVAAAPIPKPLPSPKPAPLPPPPPPRAAPPPPPPGNKPAPPVASAPKPPVAPVPPVAPAVPRRPGPPPPPPRKNP